MSNKSRPKVALWSRTGRRRTDEQAAFPWHYGMVPEWLELETGRVRHPGRDSGVFVVHGIGQQKFTETAAHLRSGFENTLTDIDKVNISEDEYLSPPYIHEGYWADYTDIKETFQQEWQEFDKDAKKFFEGLWKERLFSVMGTVWWLLKQQLKLLRPSVIREVSFMAWVTYIMLQIPLLATWVGALLFYPRIVSGFLTDFRLYLDPKGVTERAIVQRIDFRVREAFMRMLGLDWDFKELSGPKRLDASGKKVEFSRLVWVSHSLGTVISYNVLSDLFHRADQIEQMENNDDRRDRIAGVEKFRDGLTRFVTMGSPLDKIDFLFPGRISPWPDRRENRLLECDGEEITVATSGKTRGEWWINFYHVMDPVSGALESDRLCVGVPPANFHIRSARLPGWVHADYWIDRKPLKFILSRTFGKRILKDHMPRHLPAWQLTVLAFGYNLGVILFLLVLSVAIAVRFSSWARDTFLLWWGYISGLVS